MKNKVRKAFCIPDRKIERTGYIMSKVRTRFAPSPTGRMHVGNLRTALYAYLITRHEGGDFLLRIEDTDQERQVEGAVDIIYRTLEKAGITHDEGPDKDGGVGPYVQSERQKQGIYMKYAKQLVEKGEAYYCFCDKERLESLHTMIGDKEISIYALDFQRKRLRQTLQQVSHLLSVRTIRVLEQQPSTMRFTVISL